MGEASGTTRRDKRDKVSEVVLLESLNSFKMQKGDNMEKLHVRFMELINI